MLLLDDLLIKPFVSLLDILHSMVIQERYDVDSLRDELKENRLLYEIGDKTQNEYETRKIMLESQLKTAEEVHKKLLSDNIEVR